MLNRIIDPRRRVGKRPAYVRGVGIRLPAETAAVLLSQLLDCGDERKRVPAARAFRDVVAISEQTPCFARGVQVVSAVFLNYRCRNLYRRDAAQRLTSWLYAPFHQILSGLSLARTDVYYHVEGKISEHLMRGGLTESGRPALTRLMPGRQYQMSITALGRVVARYMRRVVVEGSKYEKDIAREISRDIKNLSRIYCAYNNVLHDVGERIEGEIDICSEARRLGDRLAEVAGSIDVVEEVKSDINAELRHIRAAALLDLKNFLAAMAYPQRRRMPVVSREVIRLLANWRHFDCGAL